MDLFLLYNNTWSVSLTIKYEAKSGLHCHHFAQAFSWGVKLKAGEGQFQALISIGSHFKGFNPDTTSTTKGIHAFTLLNTNENLISSAAMKYSVDWRKDRGTKALWIPEK